MADEPVRQAVLYARVSSKDKQDASQQLRILETYAASRGWPVVASYHDEVSGDPLRRGGGDPRGLRDALLHVAGLKGRGVLVISAADRLVRSPIELLQLIARIQALPGFVASMEDGNDCDTTSPYAELILFIRGWISRMELRFLRKRTRGALNDRREQIARAGGFTSKTGNWRTRLGRPSLDPAVVAEMRKRFDGGLSSFLASKELLLPESTVRTYWRRWQKEGFNPYPRKTLNGNGGAK